MVQQFFINKHLNKIPMDELIKENMEKAAEKRKNKNEVDASNVNKMAHKNVKNIHEQVRTAAQTKELEEKLEEAKKKNENAKAGSLADKANLVKRFTKARNRGTSQMNEITVSAKTLDDAITEASIQLGVASDQMEYDELKKEVQASSESEAVRQLSVPVSKKL